MFDILELNLSSIGEGNWYTSLIESQRHVGSTPTLCIRVCRELVYRGISKILGFVGSNPTASLEYRCEVAERSIALSWKGRGRLIAARGFKSHPRSITWRVSLIGKATPC